MVTYIELIMFTTMIVSIINLIVLIFTSTNNRKK